MKKLLCLILFVVLLALTVFATEPTFETGSYTVSETEVINYWLFTPEDACESMPLVVYLHGGSGKGDDVNTLTENGFCKWVSEGIFNDVPAYIVFPQLSTAYNGWAGNKTNIRNMITSIVKDYSINKEKISLVGHSMGGTGAFSLAAAYPTLFSRVMPMSGSITKNEKNLNALSQLPVWAIVGEKDTIVSPDSSIDFVAALQEAGADAKITVLEDATHFTVPELAFLDVELDVVGWLIEREATEPEPEIPEATFTIKDVLEVLHHCVNGGNDAKYDYNQDGEVTLIDIIYVLKQVVEN